MNTNLVQELIEFLGAEKVKTDPALLAQRSHDFWLIDLQRRLHGSPQASPACVVQPQGEEDVAALLAWAAPRGVAVVPFGAGSGVCGGARPGSGAIVLDMSKMASLVAVNDVALTATVEPGMLGGVLEQRLNALGYTMGHFPQSLHLSSVGGWVATRASGQFSSKYGSIEDMLVSLRAVLADGTTVSTAGVPRSSTGPSVNELILGSEGTLAVLTQLTFRIHPLPETRQAAAFEFKSFADGLEAVRLIMRGGYKPALLRLYDAAETRRQFASFVSRRGRCLLLVLSEGPRLLVDAEYKAANDICLSRGGVYLGDEAVNHWLGKRFHIPDVQELATDKGVVFDTIEVAANWDRVLPLYRAVMESVRSVPGLAHASAHSSHSYQQGTCLYFTFAVKKPNWLIRQLSRRLFGMGSFQLPADLPEVERTYRAFWDKVMEATLANGGTISHHHGVGKVRVPWIKRELGSSLIVLKRVKQALDPHGILNPGTLFDSENGAG